MMSSPSMFTILFNILLFFSVSIGAMQKPIDKEIEEGRRALEALNLDDGYDSDSEDEKEYEYKQNTPLLVPEKHGEQALAFYRGIHFSPSFFTKHQRSQMRKIDEKGKAIYSLAAYDLAGVASSAEIDNAKRRILNRESIRVKKVISGLVKTDRNAFQQLYTNRYDGFNHALEARLGVFKSFLSPKNPLASTGEIFRSAGMYTVGKKFARAGIENLNPEYDLNGKPKHPYLGKVYVILVDCSDIEKLDPYFIVYAHAHKEIKISTHFSNDILSEREVSFPGLIPGKYVVYEKMVRVPSFNHVRYPEYYGQKYGINERSYKILRTKLKKPKKEGEYEGQRAITVNGLIEKIINHTADTLEKHVKDECAAQGIAIVYKSLDDGFCANLPNIEEAKRLAKQ